MANDVVDTPMSDVFNKNGVIPEGGSGAYDGLDCPGFREYRRTPSSNAVREKIIDGSVPKPSGDGGDDQY